MKKLVLSSALILSFGLAACNGEEETPEVSKEDEVVETNSDATSNEDVTLLDAKSGDTVEVDWFEGIYTIEETLTPPSETYTSADVEFNITDVKTATLKAGDADTAEVDEETKVLILSVSAENKSDATVSFHPYTATMTTDTKRQIEANVVISEFESEFIGNVVQEGVVIFDLGSEGLDGVNELTFVFDGTAEDARTIGEDVTVKMSL